MSSPAFCAKKAGHPGNAPALIRPNMALKIYNTATRQKEDFAPQHPPDVTMYNCGPTVYDYFHIGNARNFVVVDTVRRYLEHLGYRVRFVQNLTDVDDKIINRANERNQPWNQVAERFTGEYFRNADELGIRRADVHPRATDHIPQMIELIQKLEKAGLAYAANGDVYYRVRAFGKYGELSGKNVDDLQEGARVDVGEQKEDPLDFALWKAAKPGEPSWESPWGPGRPGWHIECSAMSMQHLGETIDIHSGGHDLIFPHHENERAQSMGATGKPFVRYWLHNGFLTIDKVKMAKSLGNFFTINEVLAKYAPSVVRFYLLSAHYRHPLDYSDAALEEAKSAVARIREAVITARKLIATQEQPHGSSAEISGKLRQFEADFAEAMDDDFNTQKAMGVVFEAVALLNARRQDLTKAQSKGVLAADITDLIALVHRLLSVFGLDELIFGQEEGSADAELTNRVMQALIATRQFAKQNKQYQIADFVRDELGKIGIRLQDHPTGTIWLREES